MAKKMKQYPNPRFSSLEEEEEYWKTHSPLLEGYEGDVQKAKRKRSSFLSVRLNGEELTQLRDMAAKFGMGPSTYARQILELMIERQNLGMHYYFHSPPSFLFPSLYDSSDKNETKVRPSDEIGTTEKAYAAYLEGAKDMVRAYCEASRVFESNEKKAKKPSKWSDKKVGKRICIFDPDDMEWDPLTMNVVFNAMLTALRAKVVTPKDEDYKAVQRIVEAER